MSHSPCLVVHCQNGGVQGVILLAADFDAALLESLCFRLPVPRGCRVSGGRDRPHGGGWSLLPVRDQAVLCKDMG